MSLASGVRLGAYELVALVGAGGMGEVYRARDPRLGRDVAIKVLPSAFSTDEERLRRFEQEARAAAIDGPLGKGHVVMFAIRPFWRWQTQGTYTLGFNAIMNWNDLDAGKPQAGARGTASQPER
jgi:hypothetical protein